MGPADLDALLARAEQDPDLLPEVMRALPECHLLVPLADEAAGSADALVLDGVPHVVVFSSEEQMRRAGRTGPYATAPARELAGSLPPSVGLALNPGGTGFPVHPAGVRTLSGGRAVLPAGARVRLGEPAVEPTELLDDLARRLAMTPAVEARRVWAQIGDDVPNLVVGVACPPGGELPTSVLEAVRRAVRQADPGFAVDVVDLAGQDPFSAWMRERAEPFYRSG